MKLRNFVFAGAALLISAAPCAAQYAGNPPQESTSAEKAETQRLNQAAIDGTYTSPAVLNGQRGVNRTLTNYNSGTYGERGVNGNPSTDQSIQMPEQGY